jgi:hypothetical protein
MSNNPDLNYMDDESQDPADQFLLRDGEVEEDTEGEPMEDTEPWAPYVTPTQRCMRIGRNRIVERE